MGFFDKVRNVLTGSDAQRARSTGETGDPAQVAEIATAEVQEQPPATAAQGRTPAQEAQGGAPAEEGQGPAQTSPQANRTHTVRRGDTLAAIAEHYGVDPREMAELNGLYNPDLIYPGQVFRVPDA